MPLKLPQSDRASGGNILLAALVVVSLVLTTVYYREDEGGPIHRSRLAVQTAVAPVQGAGTWLTTPFRTFRDWTGGLGVSREELETLREQNGELRIRVAELEEARLENERLRTLVGFIEARELEAVGARVIGRPASGWEGVITIDKGLADGVDTGMPILAPQGLLGQTISVTQQSAKVRLLTDQRSGVSALVQATRGEGVVRGSIDGVLSLDYLSREATIAVGDVVLTSGMGGVYPKGLLVGEIESIDANENDLFPEVRVRPSVTIAGIEEVIVLVGAPPEAELGTEE